MSNFSRKEKIVAKILSNMPVVKAFIKQNYQILNYLFYKKSYRQKSLYKISKVDPSSDSTFFGYYDKAPESVDGKKVIYFKTSYETSKPPNPNHPVEIILKYIKTGEITVVDKSFSYNWQQGAKLMWLSNDKFIFNKYCGESKKYYSRIYNINSKSFENLNLPIYDCYKDEFALTLNFNRLMEMRPDYGYRNYKETIDYEKYNFDGIFRLSLKTNDSHLLISIYDLIKHKHCPSMDGAKHKVNHIMISPDGKRFMFMHRWLSKFGKRIDRLLVSDAVSGNFKIIADDEMVSHCCWKDNDTIVGYMRHNKEDGFYEIDLKNLSTKLLSKKLKTFNDGHPTFQTKYMVFDSYPDRSRMKKLFIYNSDNDSVMTIGEFFEPLKFDKECRCDLHPRFNNNKIYFDSVHEGYRSMYYLEFTKKK